MIAGPLNLGSPYAHPRPGGTGYFLRGDVARHYRYQISLEHVSLSPERSLRESFGDTDVSLETARRP